MHADWPPAPGDVHTAIYTSDVALWPLLVEAVAKVPPVTVRQQVVDEITARRQAKAGSAPKVQLDVEPGEPIDWRALPLGETSDAEISRALARSGIKLTSQAVGYHRKRLGIASHSSWRAKPKGIDWSAVDWEAYEGWTNVAVAEELGCSAQWSGSAGGRGWGEGAARQSRCVADGPRPRISCPSRAQSEGFPA